MSSVIQHRPITNRHTVDQFADVRDELKALKEEELQLRKAILDMADSDRVGDEYQAKIVTIEFRPQYDITAIVKHFGKEALAPFKTHVRDPVVQIRLSRVTRRKRKPVSK